MGVLHRRIGRLKAYRWKNLPFETYEGEGASGGTKCVLIGQRDGAANFSLRYFEIAPGGQSSLDCHAHDHGVFVLHGRAQVRMGADTVEAGEGDVLYIPPHEAHQLVNIGTGPLGFLCVVPPRD